MPLRFAVRCCFIVVVLALAAPGDDGSGAEAFCDRAMSDFYILLKSADSARQEYWRKRQQDAVVHMNAKADQLNQTTKLLDREPNAKELRAVFAYEYLNSIRELQLDETTRLVNDLGRELLTNKISSQLTPKIKSIEDQFQPFQGKPQAEGLQNAYNDFLQFKRRVADVEANVPVKETYVFQPMAGPYDSAPIKTVNYELRDWDKALEQVNELQKQPQPIQDRLQTARFFVAKDPNPWLTVMAQLTFLLAALPGWIKTYVSEDKPWPLVLVVLVSMVLSVLLVLYSQETFLNILKQSVAPGGFLIYWGFTKKKWAQKFSSLFRKATPRQ